MPTIDDSRGVLVVRIVYDGPAMSGKTTSLRALASRLGTVVESPEERDGRTLYFDWMDYVGGLFEGRPIRCQIVTVPGQTQLADRRQHLIETADAVVVVLDSRRPEFDFGMRWLREAAQLVSSFKPPVGLVLQANKRDAEDAVDREEIRQELKRIAPIALVESVATSADGTREAFVLAVRLALDRVRALSAAGKLLTGPPDEGAARDLLERMRSREQQNDNRPPRTEQRVAHDVDGPNSELAHLKRRSSEPKLAAVSDAVGDDELTFEPDPMMPGGMIWPPVEGRTLLYEMCSLGIRPLRTRRGDWWGSGSGWRFHSERDAIYADHDQARQELIEWARLHTSVSEQVSGGRAVILAEAGDGRLRLWQLVRVEPTLRERLAAALPQPEGEAVANGLTEVASRLIAARRRFNTGGVSLPCTLWTVGDEADYRAVYVGLMPRPKLANSFEPPEGEMLKRELAPHLRELRRVRVDFPEIHARICQLAAGAPPEQGLRWLSRLVESL